MRHEPEGFQNTSSASDLAFEGARRIQADLFRPIPDEGRFKSSRQTPTHLGTASHELGVHDQRLTVELAVELRTRCKHFSLLEVLTQPTKVLTNPVFHLERSENAVYIGTAILEYNPIKTSELVGLAMNQHLNLLAKYL